MMEWVAWFNHHRLMETLGYIPPAEAEATTIGSLKSLPRAAINLNQPSSTVPGAAH